MTDYSLICEQLKALAEESRGFVPLLSNASALLYEAMPELNWAGFYLLDQGELIVGPFQGRVACVRIAPGRGVCGTALVSGQVQRVDDVHLFPGHIACDARSASEIVLPLCHDGRIIGVLDIDSPKKARFSPEDEKGLREVVQCLEELLDLNNLSFC